MSDLRIMHAKVDDWYQIVPRLRERHGEEAIHAYSDQPVLTENIRKVDEIYLWFVKLKEEAERQKVSNSRSPRQRQKPWSAI